MKPSEAVVLYEYNGWANRRAVKAASALSTLQFQQKMGSSFSSVKDTLAHIFGAEQVWLSRFQGRAVATFPDESGYTDLAKLGAAWEVFEPKLLDYVRSLSQEDLDRVIEYKTFKFGAYSNPLWQSLQHVVNHGTYHRGQVTTMLRQHGATPILTDLMHYYRERATSAGA